MSEIREEIEKNVRQLEICRDRLPPMIDKITAAGRVLLQFDDELLEREHERYGNAPAMLFMVWYATGMTPHDLGIR